MYSENVVIYFRQFTMKKINNQLENTPMPRKQMVNSGFSFVGAEIVFLWVDSTLYIYWYPLLGCSGLQNTPEMNELECDNKFLKI